MGRRGDARGTREGELETCRARWSVDLHGERGTAVIGAFEAAAVDVWSIARMVLDGDEEEELRAVIRDWRERNPGVDLVAAVRLPFSAEAARAAPKQARAASSHTSAGGGAAADMARLLGERALFLAQRMPFLVRLHVTLAADEMAQKRGGEMPARAGEIASSAASAVEGHVRRVIVTAAVATAAVVVVAALGFRAGTR